MGDHALMQACHSYKAYQLLLQWNHAQSKIAAISMLDSLSMDGWLISIAASCMSMAQTGSCIIDQVALLHSLSTT